MYELSVMVMSKYEMHTDRDKIHLGVIATIDTLAIITNITLMGAIIFKTPKPLRTYSVFLLNNAIIDFFSATSSLLGVVRLVDNHAEGSMIFVFLGPCSMISEYLCRLSQGAVCYRLYILSDLFLEKNPSRLQIWILCFITYALISVPIIVYYFVQEPVTAAVTEQFGLQGYMTANFYLLGTPALMVNVNAVVLSPIVMTLIFIVRSKLLNKIAQAKTDAQQHRLIARALTYQMLLPCGVACAASLWMLDLAQIWTGELMQRLIMSCFNFFSLASPLINFTMLPPYRALLPFAPKANPSVASQQPFDFTTMAG
ncbi:hypothetical protein PRIPAC_88746 [Pristionchus pacificus]|uniref:G protein-coupled receptor n=1 Tax=Pristionchus pacificus TaxID=54126 RepID=A0A2A6CXT5_PRIPA|nr:hypothetical protein PRIPAC_88746 [Pristionchus pacificus]|eukprot:PDM82877.1 G protein-coupled receptor [Pristionchus pacificus]